MRRYTRQQDQGIVHSTTALTLWLLLILAAALPAEAQNEPEYRMEIGGGVGMMAYTGDLNGSPFKNMQPMGALVAKYKKNPRMAWALNVGYGQVKGSSAKAEGWLPDLTEKTADFKSSVVDVQIRYEYNFWPFGTGREYYGAKPLTPFITLGIGAAVSSAKLTQTGGEQTSQGGTGLQMPIGAGVKYKLGNRLNLTAEWVMHFTTNDKIDAVEDPYGIKRQGIFKNTDGYSTLQLSLTYDLWERCRTCHNDKD